MRYDKAKTQDLSESLKKSIQQSIDEHKGLFIYGGTGTGKTHSLYALVNDIEGAEVSNFVSLLVEFRDYMQRGLYHEKMVEMTQQKYLFIDDIGSEKTTDFVIEFLYLVVNKRYENEKRTVLTTNLSLDDFREKYGDRILSRISEMCVLVEMTGEDRRI